MCSTRLSHGCGLGTDLARNLVDDGREVPVPVSQALQVRHIGVAGVVEEVDLCGGDPYSSVHRILARTSRVGPEGAYQKRAVRHSV